jgi:hypothetical protein
MYSLFRLGHIKGALCMWQIMLKKALILSSINKMNDPIPMHELVIDLSLISMPKVLSDRNSQIPAINISLIPGRKSFILILYFFIGKVLLG